MSWLRENSLPAGLVAATLVAGGALTFLTVQSMTRYHETLDAYRQAVRRLHVLQDRSPFPNAENLEKSRLLTEQYKSGFESLRAQLAKMQVPIDPGVQPQTFQDDLRAAVNRILEKAAAARVELPKGFYLGFGQYANSLPNEYVAPALAQQLVIIERVITNLIDLKVQSIDSLNRLPLPEESTPPPRKTEEPQKGGGSPAEGLRLLPVELAFTAEQGKLRVAFNSLLDSDQFLIVRNLALQNTARVGPPISRQSSLSGGQPPLAANDSAAPGEQPPGGVSEPRKGSHAPATLNVILGRELVRTSLRIEIVNFLIPPSVKD
ncbi:MAG: Amuc_1100 family pilus-like protein [Terrimicrobiaceae bacterium]